MNLELSCGDGDLGPALYLTERKFHYADHWLPAPLASLTALLATLSIAAGGRKLSACGDSGDGMHNTGKGHTEVRLLLGFDWITSVVVSPIQKWTTQLTFRKGGNKPKAQEHNTQLQPLTQPPNQSHDSKKSF